MFSVPSLGRGDAFGEFLGEVFERAIRSFVRNSLQRWEDDPGSMWIEILIFIALLFGVLFLIKQVVNRLKKIDQGKDN